MFRQVSGLARLVTYRVFATIVWKDAAASKDNFLQSLFTTKFNEQRFKQGQAAFHRVQDVENLVMDFKSASATVTHALEELLPKTIQSVLEQNITPTLETILGETISPMLRNVLEGTFTDFTPRYESVGGVVIREVKATLELQRESLATEYTSVQSGIHEVLTCLRTLVGTDKPSPPDNANAGGAGKSPHEETGPGGHATLSGLTLPFYASEGPRRLAWGAGRRASSCRCAPNASQ